MPSLVTAKLVVSCIAGLSVFNSIWFWSAGIDYPKAKRKIAFGVFSVVLFGSPVTQIILYRHLTNIIGPIHDLTLTLASSVGGVAAIVMAIRWHLRKSGEKNQKSMG